MSAPRPIAAVALTHNGGRLLPALIASLDAQTGTALDLIVVDNGSSDEATRALLATLERDGRATVIRHDRNLGFALGYNRAVDGLLARDHYDRLLLVSDDVELAPDCVRHLAEAMDAAPGVFCAGPALTGMADRTALVTCGNAASRWNGRVRNLLERLPVAEARTRPPFECEYACGCCMLVDAAAVKRIGLFEADWFCYYEDADLCARARAAGYRTVAVPRALAAHHWGATLGSTLEGHAFYYVTRNRWWFLKRHGIPVLSRAGFFATPRTFARALGRRDVGRTYLEAVRDAIGGRTGPRPSASLPARASV